MSKVFNLKLSASAGSTTASMNLTVIPADQVIAEKSDTLKYLRLRSGDVSCYSRVFILVDGKRKEITMDSLPQEKENEV